MHTKKFLFIAFALFVAEISMATEIPGVYSVPVPTHLKAFSMFPVNYRITGVAGSRMIQYQLPEELVAGKVVQIQLEEEPVHKDGSNFHHPGVALGKCRFDKVIQCNVGYRSFGVTHSEIESFITQKYQGLPIHTQGFIDVALMFSGEPAGIVEFDAPVED